LNVVSFVLPPLRDRATDIPLLTSYFIKKYSLKNEKNVRDIQGDALNKLIGYRWPGNVRELEAAIERAILLTEKETISLEDLPQEVKEQPTRSGNLILISLQRASLLRNLKALVWSNIKG
jgi:transcriptional regulator with PAS, ATPase and Fis domain